MSFEPKSGKHAIVEVVFGVGLTKPVGSPELEKFAASHDKWKEHLPKISRSSAWQLLVGENIQGGEVRLPTNGIMFERMKPDGELEWRLRVEDNTIYVNCLSYTAWNEIWRIARQWLEDAATIVAPATPISKVFLQYIDVFQWIGDKGKYDLRYLLNEKASLVSTSILKRMVWWHLHQGWFSEDDLPIKGKLLERLHADGVEDSKQTPVVKIDSYLQLEFPHSAIQHKDFFQNAAAENLFDFLHDRNKALLREMLHPEMLKRIGLDANA